MFVKLTSLKKCKEKCQSDHHCEYAIWELDKYWGINGCKFFAVGTSMCSTEENSKESDGRVTIEIYEGDNDFDDSNIDQNEDLKSSLTGLPELIQCTPKVRLLDALT